MNIKEAGAYANFLNSKISKYDGILAYPEYLVTTIETHNKQKVTGKEEDLEIIIKDKAKEDKLIFSVSDLPNMIIDLLKERAKLAAAISKGKANMIIKYTIDEVEMSLDSAIEYNKLMRSHIMLLERVLRTNSSNTNSNGTAYIFNIEGVQTPYIYNITKETTTVIDREILLNQIKQLKKDADQLSKIIDTEMLNDKIVFEPAFDMYDLS